MHHIQHRIDHRHPQVTRFCMSLDKRIQNHIYTTGKSMYPIGMGVGTLIYFILWVESSCLYTYTTYIGLPYI